MSTDGTVPGDGARPGAVGADEAGSDAVRADEARPGPGTPGQGVIAGAEFAEWVRPSLVAMTRLARRLAPQAEPDDVVQDALLRAWQKYDTYDPDLGTPTTWLLAIVADKARAARTSRVRRLKIVDDAHEVPDPPVDDAKADIDLDRAIRRLPERQGLAVHLHYFVGLSVAETAQVMSCSAGTVKSTLFDARTALRAALGDPDD